MADAGASSSRLVSEIQTAQSLSAAEAETWLKAWCTPPFSRRFWHHQPALITRTTVCMWARGMLNGNQYLQLLYHANHRIALENAGALPGVISVHAYCNVKPLARARGRLFSSYVKWLPISRWAFSLQNSWNRTSAHQGDYHFPVQPDHCPLVRWIDRVVLGAMDIAAFDGPPPSNIAPCLAHTGALRLAIDQQPPRVFARFFDHRRVLQMTVP